MLLVWVLHTAFIIHALFFKIIFSKIFVIIVNITSQKISPFFMGQEFSEIH